MHNLDQVGRKVNGRDFDEHDIIIIGGGTAGCVLASRLSEDPSIQVLLLEAGGSGKSLLFSRIPGTFPLLFSTKHIYPMFTEPQINANGKIKFWPRAKMLGGCSSINAQMAQYGSPQDFDQWADIIGDKSWSWQNLASYFTKFEKYQHHPAYPKVMTNGKGDKGPVKVGYLSTLSEPGKDFIQSCVHMNIPLNPDFNSGNGTLGVNRTAVTFIDEARQRVSSETAYLTKEVLARPNLKVAINATVTRIILETQANGQIRSTGVEFSNAKDGPLYRAYAKREVIVCAGAVHSPQILMLSGIGSAEELAKTGIPVLRDLPGVGANLVDQPVVDLCFKNKNKSSLKHLNPHGIWEVLKFIASAIQYFVLRRGALVSNLGDSVAFFRSDDPALFPPNEIPEHIVDSTSGDNSPDIELITSPYAFKDPGAFPMHTFCIRTALLRPMSRGSVTLKSADPWEYPRLDPRYLSTSDDLKKLVRGIKVALKVAHIEPLASHLDHTNKDPLLDHGTHLNTDEELDGLVRERVKTLFRPARTCRMAPEEKGGVVDSHLRVYGVLGLRVCDASIFPEMVSGHPVGPLLATAEYLADLMKAERVENVPPK